MNVAYCANCIEALRKIPDRQIDLLIADPPYFSGPEKRGYYGSRQSKIGVHRDYPVSPAWKVPTNEDFEVLFRKARYYIVFGCNYFCDTVFTPGRIVWDKVNGSSTFSDAEIAATNLFDSIRLFRYMWNGMLQGKSIEDGYIQQGNKHLNEKRIHPTQKPIALYEWIISTYAKQGWTICDPYLGSGSSRIAAMRLGFDFVGYEKNEYYFEQQEKRYKTESSQISLFDGGSKMTRKEILNAATEIVTKYRDSQYGEPEDSFGLAAELWANYLRYKCVSNGAEVTLLREDVAVLQALLKIARIASGNEKDDNWIGIAGYAAFGGECQMGNGKIHVNEKKEKQPEEFEWKLGDGGDLICGGCFYNLNSWNLPKENGDPILPRICPSCARKMKNGGMVYGWFVDGKA